MGTRDFVSSVAASGRSNFSVDEAASQLGGSVNAREALRRLMRAGEIATPSRGFYVIVPPEYRGLGCLPAEQFIDDLMTHRANPYYAALLTAARYHGAAHHQPQVFQVMTPKNYRKLECGRVVVKFIARKNTAEMPVESLNTIRGYIRVSTPEVTAFDLVGYPEHCGGLSNVATVLSELAERLDPQELRSVAPMSPIPWAQRLGYLLGSVGAEKAARQLSEYVHRSATTVTSLSSAEPVEGAEMDSRWKVAINTEIDPDL